MKPQDAAQMKRYVNALVRKAVALNDPENVDLLRRDFYTYEAQALALVSLGSANDVINIEADSDFIMQKLSFQADIAGATQTDSSRVIPNVVVQLVDTGSGRQLMQNPIPIPSIFGWGELPFVLDNPRKFLRNSTIQVAFTNFDAAATYNVRLAFIGYKIYDTR
jgi:hypothetical protein